MSDWILRAEDTGAALLDNDGMPIRELTPDSADQLLDKGESIAEMATVEKAWRFGHVIVDEAQDLTPMQWRMVARRSRRGSMTIVGDLAQRSIGEPGSWTDHLPETIADPDYRELSINYRSPAEINDVAAALLTELAPDLSAPRSIRNVGERPTVVQVDDLADQLGRIAWGAREDGRGRAKSERRIAVIGATSEEESAIPDVQWLTPWQTKGLEFDVVIIAEPARILAAEHGLSLLYVAVTRTTERMIVVHDEPLPELLAAALE